MAPCERNEQISDERKHVGYEHNVKAELRQPCTDMYACHVIQSRLCHRKFLVTN